MSTCIRSRMAPSRVSVIVLASCEHISEAPAPDAGQFGGQRDRLVANRMEKRQAAGVQGDGLAERMHRAIAGVAVNRMAVVGQLHAQLVRAAGLRPDFQPGQVAVAARLWNSAARLAWRRRHAARRPRRGRCCSSLRSQSSRLPALLADVALDDGPVDFLDGALAKLLRQPGRRLAGAGEEQHAGDGLVEPVDDAQKNIAWLLIFLLEIMLYCPVERLFFALEVGAEASRWAWRRPGSGCLRRESQAAEAAWRYPRGSISKPRDEVLRIPRIQAHG